MRKGLLTAVFDRWLGEATRGARFGEDNRHTLAGWPTGLALAPRQAADPDLWERNLRQATAPAGGDEPETAKSTGRPANGVASRHPVRPCCGLSTAAAAMADRGCEAYGVAKRPNKELFVKATSSSVGPLST